MIWFLVLQVVRRAALGDLRVRCDAVPPHLNNGGAERGDAGLSDGAAGALSAGDLPDDARLLEPAARQAAHVLAPPHDPLEVQRAVRERWRECCPWSWRRERCHWRCRPRLGPSSVATTGIIPQRQRPACGPSRECALLAAAGATHSTRYSQSCHRTASQPLRPPDFRLRHCQPPLTHLQFTSVY